MKAHGKNPTEIHPTRKNSRVKRTNIFLLNKRKLLTLHFDFSKMLKFAAAQGKLTNKTKRQLVSKNVC